jgi:hypothetical protein
MHISVERNVVSVSANPTSPRQQVDELIIGERSHGRCNRQLFLDENLRTFQAGHCSDCATKVGWLSFFPSRSVAQPMVDKSQSSLEFQAPDHLRVSDLFALSVLSTMMFSSLDREDIIRLCPTSVSSLGDIRKSSTG